MQNNTLVALNRDHLIQPLVALDRDHLIHPLVNYRSHEERGVTILESGHGAYLLKFVTRSVAHYHSIAEEVLRQSINIEKYFSYIVIQSPFVKNHYPIEKLFLRHEE